MDLFWLTSSGFSIRISTVCTRFLLLVERYLSTSTATGVGLCMSFTKRCGTFSLYKKGRRNRYYKSAIENTWKNIELKCVVELQNTPTMKGMKSIKEAVKNTIWRNSWGWHNIQNKPYKTNATKGFLSHLPFFKSSGCF